MNIEEAKKYCEDKGIKIEGELCFDPYIGWLDKQAKRHVVLCDLNYQDEKCNNECDDIEPCRFGYVGHQADAL